MLKGVTVNTAAPYEAYTPVEETGKETGPRAVSAWHGECYKVGERGCCGKQEGPARALG